jgi:5-methyltetrahydropteroyltriglutamate--homocysteine methyltransferase
MGILTKNLGYPRIGSKRELKKAVEAYWNGSITNEELEGIAAELRKLHWQKQQSAGIDLIPSNDFSFYDHMLDMICLVGAIPDRFGQRSGDVDVDLDLYFTMARGVRPEKSAGGATQAMEMTKWFNTNYHYIVPEFSADQFFALSSNKPVMEYQEAKAIGIETQPVLLGPISFLLLGKTNTNFDVLSLVERLLPVYEQVLSELAAAGAQQIQMDEPILAMDLNEVERTIITETYMQLQRAVPSLQLFLTSYFGEYRDNLATVMSLPVQAVHLDAINAGDELNVLLDILPDRKSLSLGVVNGRNIWKNDYEASLKMLKKAQTKLGNERLIISSSCSMLHSPVSLDYEDELDDELKDWLAFADQKLIEISELARLTLLSDVASDAAFQANRDANARRRSSPRIHVKAVKKRCESITLEMTHRASSFEHRIKKQQARLKLPAFPTTTIGSFPQTAEIRKNRAQFKSGKISKAEHEQFIETEIKKVIQIQDEIGLDVLVHGESERNDMVEYFGEQLNGFAFTKNGWVQSYGSRYVKPPIIFGDVSRPEPMTVRWSTFAQSLTKKPMKGMLTGPITILQWSFVRDDQPRLETANQIALAIRDEVIDLERAGIPIIQIDEPAFREGMPLRRSAWKSYLDWAVKSFRIASSGVKDETQIHTHMCYSEFNNIIEAIAAMDADVISIEASRSKMELLQAFVDFIYPNQIGPGVWDIHSPRIPSTKEIVELIRKAAAVLPAMSLWVNPDCGLKTRGWTEVTESLKKMVAAARLIRAEISA